MKSPNKRTWLVRSSLLIVAAISWLAATAPTASSAKQWRWFKGNLHTHTTHSDGDSSPDAVARWYKEHGYQFLVLSDHNYFTDPAGLNTVFAAKDRFLLIGGEEVTSRYEKKAVHVNAYGTGRLIPPRFGPSVLETIQRNVDAIREAGAIPSLNHPNFRWSVTAEEMKRVENLKLFEIYNGHPTVHNEGGGGSPSLGEMWDVSLTAGRELFGVAVDDAHYFKQFGAQFSNPGRGWVTVKAEELTGSAILAAIRAGDFYASTGVEFEDVTRGSGTLTVKIRQNEDFRYTTRYTGPDGKLLAESPNFESEYQLQPGDQFVRATVSDSGGHRGWTQPVFAK